MTLSIVIPVYNLQNNLRVVLESLDNQTVNKDFFDVIIIDDGSTDSSVNVVEEFLKTSCLDAKLYSKKNGGVSSARNYGIEYATGDYIYFLDGDDYIGKDFIELVKIKIEEKKSDLIVTNYKRVFSNCTIDMSNDFKSYDDIDNFKFDYLYGNISLIICVLIFKRSELDELNLKFDVRASYGEDREFYEKFILKCSSISFEESAYYFYVDRLDSAVNQKVGIKREQSLIASYRVRLYLQSHCSTNKFLNVYETHYMPTRILRVFFKLVEEKEYRLAVNLSRQDIYKEVIEKSNLKGRGKIKIFLLRHLPYTYIAFLEIIKKIRRVTS